MLVKFFKYSVFVLLFVVLCLLLGFFWCPRFMDHIYGYIMELANSIIEEVFYNEEVQN